MGNATWSNQIFNTYASASDYQNKPMREVFTSTGIKKILNPKYISLRESVDSDNNPNSTPIILGLDVTGSMGKYAHEIAITHLPKLMNDLLETRVIPDPHIMFMGIDDIHTPYDMPLQVSQFEADIRIIEQLRDIYMVGGGGGNNSESYDLAWLFAAYYTKIDSYDKRGVPGFLFTFGDECAPTEINTKAKLDKHFVNNELSDVTPAELLAKAQERYQVFHVVIEQGSFYSGHQKYVKDSWNEILGNNVLFLNDSKYLSDVVIATLAIASGKNINDVINESSCKDQLTHAFQNALKTH